MSAHYGKFLMLDCLGFSTFTVNHFLESTLSFYFILFQILTLLESNIRRDYLSSDFETTNELLGLSNASGCAVDDSLAAGSVPVLPWIPQTTAAVAIRLIELDASISYMLHQKLESHKDKGANDFIVSIIFLLYKLNVPILKIKRNRRGVATAGKFLF